MHREASPETMLFLRQINELVLQPFLQLHVEISRRTCSAAGFFLHQPLY